MIRMEYSKFILVIITILFLPIAVKAEIKIFTHEVKQPFAGSQSPDEAMKSAIAKAKIEVLEKAGTYLQTVKVIEKGRMSKEKVLAVTRGILKTEIMSQENYHTEDAFGIIIVAKVTVDTNIAKIKVNDLIKDTEALTDYIKRGEREKETLKKIEKLENIDRNTRDLPPEKKKKIKRQYQKAYRELDAVEWDEKAAELFKNGKFTNPKKALFYINKAIELDPNWAVAYSHRGIAYASLGNYHRAIKELTKAIELDPNYTKARSNRGGYLIKIKKYDSAIKDLTNAINIDPTYAKSYTNRGAAYAKLGIFKLAINDLLEAINLEPDSAKAYTNLGYLYVKTKKYRKAIDSCSKAINLDSSYIQAYINRAYAHFGSGNNHAGCKDLYRACELGNCNDLKRKKNKCR
ncbi:MAG: tetratricopeptide repeat protein [Desulfobacterales bacterium]|nr:tetratricopeptide repeat protein [Desulfobacterales bacterium]